MKALLRFSVTKIFSDFQFLSNREEKTALNNYIYLIILRNKHHLSHVCKRFKVSVRV